MPFTTSLLRNATANAACIAREVVPESPSFLGRMGNFDKVSDAAIRLAEIEAANPGLWEGRSWEEACAAIASHFAEFSAPFTDAMFRDLLPGAMLPAPTKE